MQYSDALDNLVSISEDDMSASIFLHEKPDGGLYKIEELKVLLESAGVKNGIMEKQLQEIIINRIYRQKIKVAIGKKAEDGTDGKFDLFFRTKLPGTPTLLEDGSVDYKNIDLFEKVEKDQLIATYQRATNGVMGYSVKGKILMPKKGKDKPAMRGKGFHISEDNKEYYADLDGKIEFINGQIQISNIIQIAGDLDNRYGNICFVGDVYIGGSVRNGLKVEAGGNISIKGVVEAADIKAGGDILFQAGVLGHNQSKIEAKKDIYGKFFENAQVNAGGVITCNYILNSNVVALRGIEVTGKNGVIIGGETEALGYVRARFLGNSMETLTKIKVGGSGKYSKQLNLLYSYMDRVNSEIIILEQNLHVESERHEQIVIGLGMKINERLKISKKIEELEEVLEQAKDAYIRVDGDAFPRVLLKIDIASMQLTSVWHDVTFQREDTQIVTYQNY